MTMKKKKKILIKNGWPAQSRIQRNNGPKYCYKNSTELTAVINTAVININQQEYSNAK